jgi:uncharacterized protein YqeY
MCTDSGLIGWCATNGLIMNILEQIETDLVNAIKAGDTETVNVLRMAKTAIMNAKIAKTDHTLSEPEEIEVLRKENKKRQQSVEMFKQGNRQDLVEKELSELKVTEKYMPAELGDAEIESVVNAAIIQTGATTMADMGKVMGIVSGQLKGKADGSRISAIVKNHLSK